MTRSRKYLNNLPNIEEIKSNAREILDCELKLDRAVSGKEEIEKEILSLEQNLKSLDITENPQKIEIIRAKLGHLSNDLMGEKNEIKGLKSRIFNLQSVIDEEIREGLSNLFHQAKSCFDEAQQKLIKHQELADEAQNKLAAGSKNELEKYQDEWILNVQKVIKFKEKLEKCKKQLEAIKRVYTLEFG